MADPHSPVTQVVFDNEESEQKDGCSASYESPSDPCPSVKRKRCSGSQDENYAPEEEVYEH
jgi:hypothetical protein